MVLLGVFGWLQGAFAQDASKGVLVIVVNRLSLDDAKRHPEFESFLKSASVGLVSPSSLGYRSVGAVFASASTGSYSRGSHEFRLMLN
ncbi:MAG: hypothetical protein WCL39_14760, partial [Armatimonadota bacterium]